MFHVKHLILLLMETNEIILQSLKSAIIDIDYIITHTKFLEEKKKLVNIKKQLIDLKIKRLEIQLEINFNNSTK